MSIESTFNSYFKPEVRKRGDEDFKKDLGFISNASDTQVQGYVKATPPLRVSLTTSSIESTVFKVDCTCSSSRKGFFCKHVWTMLRLVEIKHSDFLSGKTSIEKVIHEMAVESPHKAKQNEYKKSQYEKQKQWAKDRKLENKRKQSHAAAEPFPVTIQAALRFFSDNGFPMPYGPDKDTLDKAKKVLARVFHPDKGGSHEEAVILNSHYDALIQLLQR